ncbi:unnamed protein product [Pedinophyceae sp. YPF-701]|nr:unnamed protein product [Pedinophyceae sp. YPF-701]
MNLARRLWSVNKSAATPQRAPNHHRALAMPSAEVPSPRCVRAAVQSILRHPYTIPYLKAIAIVFVAFLAFDFVAFSHRPCPVDSEGQWSVGVSFTRNPLALEPPLEPALTCRDVSDPGRRASFVADPFLLKRKMDPEGTWWMFVEVKDVVSGLGYIGAAKSTDGGITWRYQGEALAEPFHLSYPLVFEHDGEVYMLPEANKSGELRLYRAVSFPLRWEVDTVLLRGTIVDATLFQRDARWWIFARERGNGGGTRMSIFHANDLRGPWHRHGQRGWIGPHIKRGSRMAGRVVEVEGRLLRFGQDLRRTYGGDVIAHEVTRLTTEEFEEREIAYPLARKSWNANRWHHVDLHLAGQDADGPLWVASIDGDNVASDPLRAVWLARTGFALAAPVLVAATTAVLGSLWRRKAPRKWLRVPIEAFREQSVSNGGAAGLARWRFAAVVLGAGALSATAAMLAPSTAWDRLHVDEAAVPAVTPRRNADVRLVVMSYPRRRDMLDSTLEHYASCPSVSSALVVWSSFGVRRAPEAEAPAAETSRSPPLTKRMDTTIRQVADSGIFAGWKDSLFLRDPPLSPPRTASYGRLPVHVSVKHFREATMLNRMFVQDEVADSPAIFVVDDDIRLACRDFERGAEAWRAHRTQIVGFYARAVDVVRPEDRPDAPLTDPDVEVRYLGKFETEARGSYSMVLVGASFLSSDVPKLVAAAPAAARNMVLLLSNCDDILVNFVVADSTGKPPLFVQSPITVTSWTGISTSLDHDTVREYCIRQFADVYHGLPLVEAEFRR